MKKGLLFFSILVSSISLSSQATNLLISEYGEGSSGNSKYVEIYNGTGAVVDLTNYQLWRISNGGNWPEATYNFTTATLADGATIVIANNAGDVPGADEYTGTASWNGDDAVGLAYNGGSGSSFSLLDAIGESGPDPGSGWDVAGVNNGTKDHRLTRKSSICSPNTNWASSAGTNATDSEWIVVSYVTGSANAGHTASCSTAPVSLSSFTATAKNNKSYLYWTTASERNNDYMAIERSRDGKRFTEIGQVAGAGTTDVEQTYNFVDERPFDGINYYRLRQVDFDGKSEYHRIVSVLIDRKGEDIRIAPTAAIDKVVIYLPQTTKASAQMNIYDVTGKLWYTGVLPAGVNEESLDVSNLPNGHYILQVIEGEDVGVVRFNKL